MKRREMRRFEEESREKSQEMQKEKGRGEREEGDGVLKREEVGQQNSHRI
jgi:hypothetical protein